MNLWFNKDLRLLLEETFLKTLNEFTSQLDVKTNPIKHKRTFTAKWDNNRLYYEFEFFGQPFWFDLRI